MDGFQGGLNPSLQRNLSRWILSATAVFALLAGTVSGWVSFEQAQELQDTQLRQVATLASSRVTDISLKNNDDPEDTLIVQRLGGHTPRALPIPPATTDGLHTLTMRGTRWRVLVHTSPTPAGANQRFAVCQRTEFRNEVAWASSLYTVLPVLLLAPVLMGVARFAIGRTFKPVATLACMLDQRDEIHLDDLPARSAPKEVLPFVVSLNRLLTRLRQAIIHQQRFVSDAAHELRTPVTAISLMTENLANATSLEQAQERLVPVREGLQRMRTLVAQLLDLARLQGEARAGTRPVEFQQIVQEVIAETYPLAEAKSIDLGMPRSEPLTVPDIAANLSVLVRNAVENAIRHTPDGGRVDVSLFAENGQAILQVDDNGCGIPEAEIQQVFEPFYRIGENAEPGCGLGLTISQEISRRLGGEIHLRNRAEGGLQFQYHVKIV